MIRHVVMWRLAGDSPQEQRQARERVKQAFESLHGRIPGLRQIEVGFDRSAVDYACDVVLVADFDSQQALDGYAVHPEHLRVRQELGTLRVTRHQVDYQRH
ncbi:MAG: Dabb family protein [Burkholderiaceae bacterium]|nr:Dabb family protein [Burkholderiaceae bacterium]